MYPFKLNSRTLFFVYFYGMLYAQVAEFLFRFRITKFILLIFLLALVYVNLTRYWNQKQAIHILLCGTFLSLSALINFDMISYSYPILLSAGMLTLFAKRLAAEPDNTKTNWLELSTLFYLLINFVLYFFKIDGCFQSDGGMRYKGVLPHANMLANILFALYVLHYFNNRRSSWIVKILIVLLLIINGSRTYMMLGIALLTINLFSDKRAKHFGIRLIFCAVCGISVLVLFYQSFHKIFSRFITYGFSSNGRSQLADAYFHVLQTHNPIRIFFGVRLGKDYLKVSPTNYSHSFTENSYLAVIVLFGGLGLIIFLFFLYRLFQQATSIQLKLVILLVFLSLLTQDTILSTQGTLSILGIVLFVIHSKDGQDRRICHDRNPYGIRTRKPNAQLSGIIGLKKNES